MSLERKFNYLISTGCDPSVVDFLKENQSKIYSKFLVWIARELHKNKIEKETKTVMHSFDLFEQLNYIRDWFDVVNNINITELSIDEAYKQSKDWHESLKDEKTNTDKIALLKKKTKKHNLENCVFTYKDYSIVQLKTKNDFILESSIMQNCVDGYYSRTVSDKESQIYSLRDKDNNSHVTIEFYGNTVKQIKGKQNEIPLVKYCLPIIMWFVENDRKFNFEGCRDYLDMPKEYEIDGEKYELIISNEINELF